MSRRLGGSGRDKQDLIAVPTAVVGIFMGIATNLLSNQLPPEIVRLAWPLFIVGSIATSFLAWGMVGPGRDGNVVRVKMKRVSQYANPLLLGVRRAEELIEDPMPPYIPRDIDSQLDLAIDEAYFILIVGESGAGKSRSAYEAVRRKLPHYRLLLPSPQVPLGDLLQVFVRTRKCVLWLDDLERFLGAQGLTGVMLAESQSSAGNRRIVATIRTQEFARYSAREEGSVASEERIDLRHGRHAIDHARLVSISRIWSDRELLRASTVRDPRVIQAMAVAGQFGVAEVLADGPELALDWEGAWAAGAHPRAAALVAAAVDCRRAGRLRPVPRGVLEVLHDAYLTKRGGRLLRPESVDEALRWATAPARGTASLLIEEDDGCYLAFEYLVDRVERGSGVNDIPEDVWQLALSTDDPGEAYSIGVSAQHRGRLTIAAEAFRIALAGGVTEAGTRLADCLGELGHVQEAVEVAVRTTATATDALGPAHLETIRSKRTLVHWLNEAGRLREAMELCEELLTESSRALGDDHVETTGVRYQLGLTAGLLGDARRAAGLLAEVVDSRTRDLGPDDPDTLLARSVYARWMGESGFPAQARDLYRALEEDRARVLGPDDARTLHTRARLAYWTSLAGDPGEALSLYRALLADRVRVLGVDHQHTLHTRSRVALWTALNGDSAGAVELFQRVIEDRMRVLGDGHPATLVSRLLMSDCLGESGHQEEAVTESEAVLADYTRLLGSEHPDTLIARAVNARWIGECGEPLEAARLLADAGDDCTRLLGRRHPLSLTIRNNSAYWLEEAGHDVVAAYEAIRDDCVDALGEDHPDTMLVENNLAHCLRGVGRGPEAVSMLEGVVARSTRVLGPDHPDTRSAMAALARWQGDSAPTPPPVHNVGNSAPVQTQDGARQESERTIIDGLGYEPHDIRLRKRG